MASRSYTTGQKELNTDEYINIWGLFLGHIHAEGQGGKN